MTGGEFPGKEGILRSRTVGRAICKKAGATAIKSKGRVSLWEKVSPPSEGDWQVSCEKIGEVRAARPSNQNTMKNSLTPLLFAAGAAVTLGLSSCVAPYDAYGSTTVTTYSPGHRINTLPSGYRTEIIGSRTYYYHNGAYYNRGGSGYVVVDRPHGSRHQDDWSRHNQRDSRDQRDRYDNRRDQRDGYRDRNGRWDNARVMTRLPGGYRTVTHRGQQYYTQGNSYYRRQGNGYVTVNAPF